MVTVKHSQILKLTQDHVDLGFADDVDLERVQDLVDASGALNQVRQNVLLNARETIVLNV